MGFSENKKLAKDINNNTDECTQKLETLLASINSQMGLMNSLISSISGGYVSKDYVDMGDAALREELDALLEEFDNKRYVGSDNDIATIFSGSARYIANMNGGVSYHDLNNSFTAKYSGTIRLKITAAIVSCTDGLTISIYAYNKRQNGGTLVGTFVVGFEQDDSTVPQSNYTVANVAAGVTYYFSVGVSTNNGSGGNVGQLTFQNFSIGADIVMG